MLFVVCFAATFPHDVVLQRALSGATRNMPIRVETGRGSLGWTLAYGIESLRVRAREGDGEPFLLADALHVAPSRFGLLRGNPYPVGIDAALYGGTLRGTIDPRPASFGVDATLEAVDLSRYTGLRPWVEGPSAAASTAPSCSTAAAAVRPRRPAPCGSASRASRSRAPRCAASPCPICTSATST